MTATPPPRFHTPRRPERPSYGRAIDRTSTGLGRPLMPWQRRAVDVATEIDPDTGRFAYPLVIISVPRQSGKTALTLATAFHRGLLLPNGRVWFTAQTGMHARDSFLEMARPAKITPFGRLFDLKRGAGDTRIEFAHNMSQLRPHPPTEDSLHSKQSDLNLIDEAWVFGQAEAEALMAAITPTQATRPMRQTIILSTRGTAASTWFHGLIESAKDNPRVCLVDYGIGPDDDPADLDVIAAAHPAYGHTVDMAALQDAQDQLSPGEFARAYGNRPTGAAELIWPADLWARCQTVDRIPDMPVCFAAAVSIDRTETAIAAAVVVDGVPFAEVVDVLPGTEGGAARLAQLTERHDHTGPWIDRGGPSATLAAECDRDALPFTEATTRDVSVAHGDMYDRVMSGRIRCRVHPSLTSAVSAAAWRNLGDGGRAFGRRASAGSIAALEAVALAAHGAAHDVPMPAPMIWTPNA
ncbi:terminase [Nocardia sp. NPDC057272]|uniref:terminase n=1 Tax=Nocardia sp. NPDC057272 TaxID=3346079 RepID=UPI0036301CE2